MKKYSIYFLLSAAVLALTISGCKKDEDNNQAPTAVSSTDLFKYNDSWGLFAGVNTVTKQKVPVLGTEIEVKTGTAVAALSDAQGGSTYVDLGSVKCNSESLTKQSTNVQFYQINSNNPTGIDFSSGSSWVVSGSAANFTHNFSNFPKTPTIASPTTVTRADGYNFIVNYGGSSQADSVLFILASGSNYVEKRLGGSTTVAVFSASDLSTLGTGTGLLQITPYNYERNTTVIPGKPVYFVNQTTVSQTAEFK